MAATRKALVAGIVFGRNSIESLIGKLNRNFSPLSVCGFSPVPTQRRVRYGIEQGTDGAGVKVLDFAARAPVPGSHGFSGFLSNAAKLERKQGLVSKIDSAREELMKLLSDFWEKLDCCVRGWSELAILREIGGSFRLNRASRP